MTKQSDRITRLSESQTLAMARKSRELIAQGVDIINLSLGEPDFDTPQYIKDAAKEAIDNNYTHYPPVAGYPDLREAISKKFKRDNDIHYSPEQIVVSTGAKQAIANVVLSLVNPGDEVLLPSPYWVSYPEQIKLAEGKPIVIHSHIDDDFKVTPQQIADAITPKTKLLLFSSPCNPTGTVYTKDELKSIAKVIAPHENIYIISDEIYEHIIFDEKHESIAQFDFIKDRVIIVNGVSKGFAMTGWRIGYIGAPEWIAKASIKIQGQVTSGTCTIAQKAAVAAINANPSSTYEMRDTFKRRWDFLLDLLNEIPGFKTNIPQGAFYIFPDVSYYFGKSDGKTKITSANDLSIYLLNEANVAIVTGEAFGDPNCIRISYSASDDKLIEAVVRIKKALIKLK